MKWFIQTNINFNPFRNILECLDFLEEDVTTFRLSNETTDIETILGEYKFDKCQCFGSTKFISLIKNTRFEPRTWIQFDNQQEYLTDLFGSEYINFDSKLSKLKDINPKTDIFIKPSGIRSFGGGIYNLDQLQELKSQISLETLCVWNYPKDITNEIRFWIVDQKIVTYSYYIKDKEIIYDNNVPEYILNYVGILLKNYKITNCTLDICITNKSLKVLEINCINSSGLYDCSEENLILSLLE